MSILDKTNFTKVSQTSTIKEYKIERAKMLHEYYNKMRIKNYQNQNNKMNENENLLKEKIDEYAGGNISSINNNTYNESTINDLFLNKK
jgi:hypothetical protein